MKFNCKTPKELLKKIKNEDIKMVDLRFTDMPGSTHHISIPIKYLTEDLFKDGVLAKPLNGKIGSEGDLQKERVYMHD